MHRAHGGGGSRIPYKWYSIEYSKGTLHRSTNVFGFLLMDELLTSPSIKSYTKLNAFYNGIGAHTTIGTYLSRVWHLHILHNP
jgi:hypothetical protein